MSEKQNNIPQIPDLDLAFISVPEQDLQEINVSGSNQKKLLIVCEEEEDQAANINLLQKILEAVKFNLEQDCLFVSLKQNQGINFAALHKKESFKNVLIFGPISRKLGLNFEYEWYYPVQHNGCQYLFANRLSVIANDRTHKGALWGALKEVFL